MNHSLVMIAVISYSLTCWYTAVLSTEVEIRTPSGHNTWTVHTGAYIGDGIVLTIPEALRSTNGTKPLVLFPGSGNQILSYAHAVADLGNIAAVRVRAPSNAVPSAMSHVRFDDRARAIAFLTNLRTEWGIRRPSPPPTVTPTPSKRGAYVRAEQSGPNVSKLAQDVVALESGLALARAKISALRADLAALSGLEAGVTQNANQTAGIAASQNAVETSLTQMSDELKSVFIQLQSTDERLSSLEGSTFRVVVIFPSGERFEGPVQANGGLLELDFSGQSPKPTGAN